MSKTQDPATGPATNNTSSSNAPANRQPKKKNGIFSFLSCCTAPEDANTVDASGPVAANKITKVPSNRPTTASRPEQPSSSQQNNSVAQPQTEKDALKRDEPRIEGKAVKNSEPSRDVSSVLPIAAANGHISQSTNSGEQPLPDLPQETENSKAPISSA